MSPIAHLSHWLRREPRPASLRVDGKVLQISSSRRRWANAAEDILAMGGVSVEALAADGTILRATEVTEEVEEPVVEDVTAKPVRPELAELAEIITKSNDDAVGRQVEAFQVSSQSLISLVEMLCKRLVGVESALHRELVNKIRAADGDEPEGKNGQLDGLMGALVQAATAKAGIPTVQPKPKPEEPKA